MKFPLLNEMIAQRSALAMGTTKRYRLVIDYEVEVLDWEPSGWHGPHFHTDAGTNGFKEWAENQRRLFDAVTKDPRRMEQMCQRSVLDALEMGLAARGKSRWNQE
ncbi:MAG: hypothetical protein DMG65_12595 [Candidatus Angelobacter sp. Gp1-AA117]|nr:MAG: hypothetical protein DMG65_12595 [Candidatus Angelobacter sp. Gp1-AA117]